MAPAMSLVKLPVTSLAVGVLGCFYIIQCLAVAMVRVMSNKRRAGAPSPHTKEAGTPYTDFKGANPLLPALIYPFTWFFGAFFGAQWDADGNPVSRSDQDDVDLVNRVIRAQQNSGEYFPIFLILLLVRELQFGSAESSFLYTVFFCFLGARIFHWFGLAFYGQNLSSGRVVGALGCMVCIVVLAASILADAV